MAPSRPRLQQVLDVVQDRSANSSGFVEASTIPASDISRRELGIGYGIPRVGGHYAGMNLALLDTMPALYLKFEGARTACLLRLPW